MNEAALGDVERRGDVLDRGAAIALLVDHPGGGDEEGLALGLVVAEIGVGGGGAVVAGGAARADLGRSRSGGARGTVDPRPPCTVVAFGDR